MHSKRFKNFMAKLYGFGASIVILGAMFKLLHLPGAGTMLGVGLTTEAIIFFFSAFEKPGEEYDWSLVYPELAGMDAHASPDRGGNGGTVSQELDKLMAEAKIGPELIHSLGEGLKTFGDKVATISSVSDVATNANDFSTKLKTAGQSVDGLSSAYADASNSLGQSVQSLNLAYTEASNSLYAVSNTAGDAKLYHEQMQHLTKNLSSLNAMYELELQDSNNHLKALNKFYSNMNETIDQFNNSINDAKSYKDEVGKLAKNLASLNAVYGNMLAAMNAPRA